MVMRAGIGYAKAQHDAIDETRLRHLGADGSEVISGAEHEFVFARDQSVAFK